MKNITEKKMAHEWPGIYHKNWKYVLFEMTLESKRRFASQTENTENTEKQLWTIEPRIMLTINKQFR